MVIIYYHYYLSEGCSNRLCWYSRANSCTEIDAVLGNLIPFPFQKKRVVLPRCVFKPSPYPTFRHFRPSHRSAAVFPTAFQQISGEDPHVRHALRRRLQHGLCDRRHRSRATAGSPRQAQGSGKDGPAEGAFGQRQRGKVAGPLRSAVAFGQGLVGNPTTIKLLGDGV